MSLHSWLGWVMVRMMRKFLSPSEAMLPIPALAFELEELDQSQTVPVTAVPYY